MKTIFVLLTALSIFSSLTSTSFAQRAHPTPTAISPTVQTAQEPTSLTPSVTPRPSPSISPSPATASGTLTPTREQPLTPTDFPRTTPTTKPQPTTIHHTSTPTPTPFPTPLIITNTTRPPFSDTSPASTFERFLTFPFAAYQQQLPADFYTDQELSPKATVLFLALAFISVAAGILLLKLPPLSVIKAQLSQVFKVRKAYPYATGKLS